MVTSSKSLACWVTVGPVSGAWGSCGVCVTLRLVSSTKPTRGERRDSEAVGGVPRLLAPYCPDIVRILWFDALLRFTSPVATALEVPAKFLSKSLIFRKIS